MTHWVTLCIPGIPGIPGNDIFPFPIPGNEKSLTGMNTLAHARYIVFTLVIHAIIYSIFSSIEFIKLLSQQRCFHTVRCFPVLIYCTIYKAPSVEKYELECCNGEPS